MAEPWGIFEAPYRVRFDESGPDGLVRTSSLLRYAQDIAWQHSDARGYDRAWYGERGLTWVVRAVEIIVRGAIPMGSTLAVTTRVLGHRRVWSRRHGEFFLPGAPDGDAAASVTTDWLLLDAANRPTRIPPEFEAVFDLLPASNGLIRVAPEPPPPDAWHASVSVRPQELDPLAHANNAVYVDWLEESVAGAEGAGAAEGPGAAAAGGIGPTGGLSSAIARIPRRYRVEYAGSAEPGEPLDAATWPADGSWAWRLADAAGAELVRARLGGA